MARAGDMIVKLELADPGNASEWSFGHHNLEGPPATEALLSAGTKIGLISRSGSNVCLLKECVRATSNVSHMKPTRDVFTLKKLNRFLIEQQCATGPQCFFSMGSDELGGSGSSKVPMSKRDMCAAFPLGGVHCVCTTTVKAVLALRTCGKAVAFLERHNVKGTRCVSRHGLRRFLRNCPRFQVIIVICL